MKTIDSSDKAFINELFSNSIYENTHLGWFNLWQLQARKGIVVYDNLDSSPVLLALQPLNINLYWIHSFISKKNPQNINIVSQLREILPAGNNSVYTISSHPWYSRMLAENGFSLCDNIIQLETDNIQVEKNTLSATDFTFDLIQNVYNHCENSFPNLWKLDLDEFLLAYQDANFKKILLLDGIPAGYILANIENDSCHILRIAVARAYQQKKIATMLVQAMVSFCVDFNIHLFSVNTNKKNIPAINFYRNLGFKPVESKQYPVYYRAIIKQKTP